MKNRIVLGLTAPVVVFGNGTKKEIIARVDTGATKCSIDKELANQLKLGPELKHRKVRSAHGTLHRPIILGDISIAGELFRVEFTLADRAHMKYKVLIGQNILKKGFLIDPLK